MGVAAPELLAAWEDCAGRRPAERAVALAGASELTVGELDRRLLELRRSAFGDEAATVADCPACGELPEALAAAVAERMAAADPQAAARVALRCPACAHEWEAPIDAGAFLWAELDAWARRTLHEVHVLASAYGWSEEAILALGPRRRVYLELAAG